MRSSFFRTSRLNAGRQLEANTHRSLCEVLETRRLLSVTAAEAADGISQAEQDVVGTYTGELRLRRGDDEGRRLYDMTLRITDQDDDGSVDGSITLEPRGATGTSEEQTSTFENGEFGAAPKWRMHLTLNLDGDFDGLFDGHVNPNNEDRIEGGLRDAENRRFGSFKLDRTDDGGGNGGSPTPTPTTPTPPTTPPPGTQPGGPGFPIGGGAGFAVLEVNAETGVNITNINQALNLLDDFNTAQAGDAADSDDADAIAQYSVGQINFGPSGEQFLTAGEQFGHDNIAVEAVGVVSLTDPAGTASQQFTLGVASGGAARVFVNDVQVLDLTADDVDGTEEALVTLQNGDVIRVVHAEVDSAAGTEQLQLFVRDPANNLVAVGAEGSGIAITAPQTPPGPVTGQPGTGQPGTGQPGTGEPGTGQPGTGEPGTGTPGTGEPGTGQPGTGEPGTGTPGTGEPGTGQPGTGTPGTGEPGTGQPGTGQPGTGEPGTGEPVTPIPTFPIPGFPEFPGFPTPDDGTGGGGGGGEDNGGGVIVTPIEPTIPAPDLGGGDGTDGNFPPAGPGTPGSGPGSNGSGPGTTGDNTGVGDNPGGPAVGQIPGNSNSPTAGDNTSGAGTDAGGGTNTGTGSGFGAGTGGTTGGLTPVTSVSGATLTSAEGGLSALFSEARIEMPSPAGGNSFTGIGRTLRSL
jgi:hypothetical protein